jgi:hypothetical protein
MLMMVFAIAAKKIRRWDMGVIGSLMTMTGQEKAQNHKEPEYCMSMSLIEYLMMMAERAIDQAKSQAHGYRNELLG